MLSRDDLAQAATFCANQAALIEGQFRTGEGEGLTISSNDFINPFYGGAATLGDIVAGAKLVTVGREGVAWMEVCEVADGEILETNRRWTLYFLDTDGKRRFIGDMGIWATGYTDDELFVWNSYYFTIVDTPENRQAAAYYLLNLHKEAELAGGANLAAQESARRLLGI